MIYGGYRLYLQRKPYEWSGTVEARTISVGSRVGGRIARVLVREGDAVQPRQALIELEAGDLPAQLVQANAQQQSAQAVLDKLRKGARPEELEQVRAQLRHRVVVALRGGRLIPQDRGGAVLVPAVARPRHDRAGRVAASRGGRSARADPGR